MALYRFEAQIIGRGQGRQSVAAAAYRSGQTLTDERTGVVFDYQSRHGVRHAEILVPDHTPPIDREALWNRIEASERRADAQLAREFLVALPYELTDEQNLELVRGFIRDELLTHGIVADLAMHGPDRRGDLRNVHAHIMTTLRPYRADGTFGAKTDLRSLNDRAQLLAWRTAFEIHVNRALERAHVRERVDSHARPKPQIFGPEPKQGPFATELERRGRRTFAGDERRASRRQREREEQRQRAAAHSRDRLRRVVREYFDRALQAVSPLIASGAVTNATGDVAIEHPARDRWWEFRHSMTAAQHTKTPAPPGWTVTRRENVMLFSKGNAKIENDGARIRITGRVNADTANAALDVLQANGWTSVRIRRGGSAADRVAVIAAALQRGIEPVVDGKDKALVAEVRKLQAKMERSKSRGETHVRSIDERNREEATQQRYAQEREQLREEHSGPVAPATSAAIVEESLKLLTQQRSTFTRRDLEKTLEGFSTAPEHLAELLVAAREHEDLLELSPDERGYTRYTTRTHFAKESRFLEDAVAKAKQTVPGLNHRIRDEIQKEKGFTEHQGAAFTKCTGGQKLVLLRGIAGGGKSYLMGGVREYFERNGFSMHGGALAGVAADGLAAESGIEDSRSIAQWRAYFEHNPPIERGVFILDEAGMAGTEDIDALLRKFEVVILVGDEKQLQPISAGAPFRVLWERLPDENKAELSDPRRQKLEWMQQATRLFYEGKTREALRLYDVNGRWVETKTRQECKDRIVQDWTRERDEFPDQRQLVMAYTRADVLDMNLRLRAVLRERGELEGPDVELEMTNGKRSFAVKEEIYFHEPWTVEQNGERVYQDGKEVKIRNGTSAIITAIDAEKKTISLRIPDKKNLELTVPLAVYRSFDYNQCRTNHTAQGKTVDRAYFLVTPQKGMQSDLAYVGKSRHRWDSKLYWNHEQFKNKNHVYRTLERFEVKDYSIDYSRDDAHIGFGVPNQSRTGVAQRAPYQIRIELDQVLRTAEHLRESAPAEQRAAAQKAFAEVQSWYQRLDRKLRDLEARDVRAVAIKGTAETFAERLSLLETSVVDAVDRVEEVDRGRASERLEAMRLDVAQLRASIDDQRRRALAALSEVEVVLLAPPARAFEEELRRLQTAAELSGPTAAEERRIAALSASLERGGPDAAAARESLVELHEDIYLRQIQARTALQKYEAQIADPEFVAQAQRAYDDRLQLHARQEERRHEAEEVLRECDRQEREVVTTERQIASIASAEVSHEKLDRVRLEEGLEQER